MSVPARPLRYLPDRLAASGAGPYDDYDLDNCPGTPLKIAWQRSKERALGAREDQSMNYEAYFSNALDRLRDERRYRVFADLERLAGRYPRAIWHSPQGPRDVVVWCSNDYLGMAQHPKVIGAMVETATRMGTGAGGTRNIAGTNYPLVELERELADLHGKPAALVFTSGYVSNETGISTIAKLIPNCLILSDAYNHNSMIEGIRQSGCEKKIWRHNDVAHLEELLKAADPARPKLIAFESLYSMDGDVAPVHAICDLAVRHNARRLPDLRDDRHRAAVRGAARGGHRRAHRVPARRGGGHPGWRLCGRAHRPPHCRDGGHVVARDQR